MRHTALASLLLGGAMLLGIASPGGFPIVEGGKLIGAVGCSGGTGDQDAAACKAGADLVK